jgi:hypothetical protein
LQEIKLHQDFFNFQDLIQSRYELVRLVKYEKKSIIEAIALLGFKSRSSYYLFARQFREQGFIGLYDLRPVDRKITLTESSKPKKLIDDYSVNNSKRPSASLL